ncbi:transposase InsO family protein [Glaciimonas immobilis]|uniref:Transposase InsO family protein n=1 Tax=Glaciimonas immobilis TaxID=728004 RepID=A0A840RTR3_9BURK|nr:transposase InsO family protein [Glaciimonas immobilis]
MIRTPDRQTIVALVADAERLGSRRSMACAEAAISMRTLQRWLREGGGSSHDRRTSTGRCARPNKLSVAERAILLQVANSDEFASLPPGQIVPALADRGEYLASESTFYRVLKADAQQHHRGRSKKPVTRTVTSHCATAPNQLWSWDITWMPAAVKGQYFYWTMLLDVFSRKIVGHEVHVAESAELAAILMRRASLAEGLAGRPLVLHSDNGSPMTGATMLATLEQLGVGTLV